MSINSPVTSTYQATQQFFTWREALLTALRSRSTQKPRVSRDYDGMWLVTTYPAMYAINTAS